MGGIFSSSSSSKQPKVPPRNGGTVSAADRAVLDLKNARDRLSRYKKRLDQDDAKLVEKAREAKAKGQTKTALMLLQLRRSKQREVESVENQLLTVLQMVQTIDSKQNEAQVLSALKRGKDTLQVMHEQTTVEDVLQLMDQIQEQNEVEKEITGILENVPELSPEDELAVEAELEALALDQALPHAPIDPLPQHLPVAPTGRPQKDDAAQAEKQQAESEEGRVAVPAS